MYLTRLSLTFYFGWDEEFIKLIAVGKFYECEFLGLKLALKLSTSTYTIDHLNDWFLLANFSSLKIDCKFHRGFHPRLNYNPLIIIIQSFSNLSITALGGNKFSYLLELINPLFKGSPTMCKWRWNIELKGGTWNPYLV